MREISITTHNFRQDIKGTRWMPWHLEAMKDVTTYDMLRGAGSKL